MKALVLRSLDAPPRIEELPDPVPARGEILVRIAAAGLNFADLLMARGQYQERPELPAVMGLELAGTVLETGPGTEGPPPGTRVAVFSGGGGFAELGAFPAERCIPIPDEMSFETAAGFQIAYGTSHLALSHRARLRPGETLVVLGAAGGVGLTAVELGKVMGARVIACARGADKLDIAKAAGADVLIDTAETDLKSELRALGGVDVVYDAVGGELGEAAFAATNRGGRFLLIGFASGDLPRLKPNHMLVKNIDAMGLYWGGYLDLAPKVLTASLAELFRWYAERRLKPHVSEVMPLARADEAFEALRSRRSTGKVVLTTQA